MKGIVRVFFILFSIFFVLAIGCGIVILYCNSAPESQDAADINFIIRKGETLLQISQNLEKEGLIRSAFFLRFVGKILDTEKDFDAGYYVIKRGLTTFDIHNLIVSGGESPVRITIPEGWTKTKIALHYEANGLSTKDEILKAIRSEELREKYSIPGADCEGFLFPETYFFSRSTSATKIVDTMIETFFGKLEEIGVEYQVVPANKLYAKVIMASIIEREYRLPEEAPIIASVFYNRDRRSVGLESCATIEYIITEIYGQPHPEYITLDMKEIDSPYNTYKWHGLPPGPVSNPGLVALRAAFYPAKTDYWYFCVKDPSTGEHYFSEDLEEHNAAKWYYLKKYGSPPGR
ncbi:MAG: endolytic transglycosylase MltG [Spirochaetales bacterium]|nr:endolytic transglycosylase MltG [Spirochaetales bacterium]